jgi:hypothetical protein
MSYRPKKPNSGYGNKPRGKATSFPNSYKKIHVKTAEFCKYPILRIKEEDRISPIPKEIEEEKETSVGINANNGVAGIGGSVSEKNRRKTKFPKNMGAV